jgi:pilus assembly protein CpaF
MMDQQRFLECRAQLMSRLEMSRDMPDSEILDLIDDLIAQSDPSRRMRFADRYQLKTELFNSVRRLDILSELLDDDSVTEIMVNGMGSIYIERAGRLLKWEKSFSSREKLQDIIQAIVAYSNRVANESVPIVDARLQRGERVNIVMNPIAIDGPVITIRRFPEKPISMEKLISWGSVSEEAAAFLKGLVQAGYNIFISGGTGSGKTTFLNALSNFIPKDERIITIEDAAELQLRQEHVVTLEARPPNIEGAGEITIRDLLRNGLHMRPDRIIVGECRSGEALDMIQAMTTGQAGSLSTGHANTTRDMLRRLETMILMTGYELPLRAIREQIASAVDVIVHTARLRDGSRKIVEIAEVLPLEHGEYRTRTLMKWHTDSIAPDGTVAGRFLLGEKPSFAEDAKIMGIELPEYP